MKSEKALKVVEETSFRNSFYCNKPLDEHWNVVMTVFDVKTAIELAEQEAEERMRDELTRWHDPKEELPKKHHRVLLKVRKNSYAFIETGTLQATDDGVRFIFSDCDDCEVIGWREIHE